MLKFSLTLLPAFLFVSTFATAAPPVVEKVALDTGLKKTKKDHHHDRVNSMSIPQEGVAVLHPTKGEDARGVIRLMQTDRGLRLVGKVQGLSEGKHGFHIHQYGDLRDPQGKSAGGHYNPADVKHGSPTDDVHHAGDLGNIEANADGVAEVNILAKGLNLHLILGRAIVVHGAADDFESQPSGDAGPRVALGVIGIAKEVSMDKVKMEKKKRVTKGTK